MDLGCRGSGRRAWPRRPEFDQVGVWIEEVGADALRRVSALSSSIGDAWAVASQDTGGTYGNVLDGLRVTTTSGEMVLSSSADPGGSSAAGHLPLDGGGARAE